MRAAIFGDVGGQLIPFVASLQELGVNLENGIIPDDLTIIQVGDLIHKGPYTARLVNIVETMRQVNNPGKYIQLCGNHEAQHLNGYNFWECSCSEHTINMLRQWHAEGFLKAAFAFGSDPVKKILQSKSTLITHAGLTHHVWKSIQVKNDGSVQKTANNLNSAFLGNELFIHHAGVMLGMGRTSWAGPFWAHSTNEVYPSWTGIDMPFNQVHGHTAPYNWAQHRWYMNASKQMRKVMHAYENKSIVTYSPGNSAFGNFAAVDPGYEEDTVRQGVMPYLLVNNFQPL